MNSSYHSSFPPFSIDLNEDLNHDNQLQPVAAYASSSLPNYPFFINPSPQEAGYDQRELQPAQLQDQANIYVSGQSKGSFCDHQTLKIKNDDAAVICKEEEGNIGNQQDDHRSLKWVSSKMRLMKKMISSDDQTTTVVALPAAAASSIQKFDHDQEDQKKIISPPQPPQPDNNSSRSSSNNNITTTTTIRVCSDCNTTKTPLWRSGPRGPKSLCNACGIRQRKARRAMAAADAAAGSTIFGANNNDHEMQPVKANVQIQKKEKKPISAGSSSSNNNNNNNANNNNSHLPFKKRCTQKAARAARKMNINSSKICLEDLTIILSKKYSSFQRVFPQDEKDAAILLMALSYGALVHA